MPVQAEIDRRANVADCRHQIDEWLTLLCAKRSSTYLARQLTVHLCKRRYSVHTIFDEIQSLEGSGCRRSMTKAARSLRGKLRGIWHVHHFQARWIFRNIHIQIMKDEDLRSKAIRIEDGLEPPSEVHNLVMEAWARRSTLRRKGPTEGGKVTGEWLLFMKIERINYYLCLAEHNEADEVVLRRVVKAAASIPQLAAWRGEMMKRIAS